MSRYIVRSWKTVMGDRGQESQICQASLEVDARTKEQAAEIAKRTFCDAQARNKGADALSTAFSLMPEERIRSLLPHADVERVHLVDASGKSSEVTA